MNVKEFAASLADSLTERGIPHDVAVRNAISLTKTFTEDDLREITEYRTPSDFSSLTDSLFELIKEKEALKENKPSGASGAVRNQARIQPEEVKKSGNDAPAEGTSQYKTVQFSPQSPPKTDNNGNMGETVIRTPAPAVQTEEAQEIILGDDSSIREKVKLTPRGKAFFWTFAVLTSPLSVSFCALLLTLFVISIATVAFVIAFCIALVIGEAAVGCAGALTGVIYGAIQIFSGSPGIGIYEIGLGIVISGASLGLAILTYNLAAVVMPYVMKQLLTFWGYFVKRLIPVIGRFREECNRL